MPFTPNFARKSIRSATTFTVVVTPTLCPTPSNWHSCSTSTSPKAGPRQVQPAPASPNSKYVSAYEGRLATAKPAERSGKEGQKTIPKDRLRWSVWAKGMTGENLVRFVRDEVLPSSSEIGEQSALSTSWTVRDSA